MSITVQVEIGSYEVGRRVDVVVPDETLESAQLAFREGMSEIRKAVDSGEFEEDDACVVQIWYGDRCWYDYMNLFSIYW